MRLPSRVHAENVRASVVVYVSALGKAAQPGLYSLVVVIESGAEENGTLGVIVEQKSRVEISEAVIYYSVCQKRPVVGIVSGFGLDVERGLFKPVLGIIRGVKDGHGADGHDGIVEFEKLRLRVVPYLRGGSRH